METLGMIDKHDVTVIQRPIALAEAEAEAEQHHQATPSQTNQSKEKSDRNARD